MILPGATLGMLGGGQLGRMFTVAAHTMGYRVVVLDPDPDSPAGRIADEHLHAAYTDNWALRQLEQSCDVITTEFENVPAKTLSEMGTKCLVRPAARALALTQDRIQEKLFVSETGLATTPFWAVENEKDLVAVFAESTPPLILKRSSLGYDGKGQTEVSDLDSANEAFAAFGRAPCILEQKLHLKHEISVVLARSSVGDCTCFPVAENEHENGILSMSLVPARVDAMLAGEATQMATTLAAALDYCGVMAVEFFITDNNELLVNEIAPRPHNSGHYTLDACVTSQFEQHVRMVCDLPAGETRLLSPVVMTNVLGNVWKNGVPNWHRLLCHPNVKLHLYGKRQARAGRKMGHFCCLHNDLNQAQRLAKEILEELV